MQQLITDKKLKVTFPAATKMISKCIKIYESYRVYYKTLMKFK